MEIMDYFEQGYDKQNAEQYTEAIAYYDKVLELDKDFERAYVQRAYCKSMLQQYESAIEDYKIALKLNPNDAITYFNMGCMIFKLDNKTTDTSYFDKAISMDSDNMAEAYLFRGTIHENIGEYQKAVEDYTNTIRLGMAFDTTYYKRGYCYHCLEQYEKAIEDYTKAIELGNNMAYYNRATSYNLIGEYNKALADYQIAIDIAPNDSVIYNSRGMCYHLYMGEYSKALDDYKKAKELAPSNTDIDENIKECEEALAEKLATTK